VTQKLKPILVPSSPDDPGFEQAAQELKVSPDTLEHMIELSSVIASFSTHHNLAPNDALSALTLATASCIREQLPEKDWPDIASQLFTNLWLSLGLLLPDSVSTTSTHTSTTH
jgi:hypothetical protein